MTYLLLIYKSIGIAYQQKAIIISWPYIVNDQVYSFIINRRLHIFGMLGEFCH